MPRQIKNMKQRLFSPLGGDAAGRGGQIEPPCHLDRRERPPGRACSWGIPRHFVSLGMTTLPQQTTTND